MPGEDEKGLTDEERCKIAWEIGFDEAMRTCLGDEKKGKETAFKSAGPLLGFTESESNDVSGKCSAILEKAITKDLCFDFRGIRQWVMCRAWELWEKERIRFGDAIGRAWSEIKDKCRGAGAYI